MLSGSSEERRRRLWTCTTWYSLLPIRAVPWAELYTTHSYTRITPTTTGQELKQPGRRGIALTSSAKVAVGRLSMMACTGVFILLFCFHYFGGIGFKGKQRIRPITFTIQADSEGLLYNYPDYYHQRHRLCGLVVRVSGYRYRGLGFDFRRYQIFWVAVGLERGALSLVSLVRSIEELLE